jgi:poly-gamma-glutamate synthesis protein (capsule biosynthesis protein)
MLKQITQIKLILLALVLFAGCSGSEANSKIEENQTKLPSGKHYSFFDSKEIYEGYYQNLEEQKPLKEKVVGAVLPHHLFVGEEFARSYSSLANLNPEVVVVIGPNHFEAGFSDQIISSFDYQTPYGVLENDQVITQKLLNSKLVTLDNQPFAREHAISSHTAFIKKTFPKAKLVPIILKWDTYYMNAERLGQKLLEILPENSLVIASVDFSHYQSELVADFHDQTSFSTIANFDFSNIDQLELDSPATITAFLTYLQGKNAQKLVYKKHTNSASYVNNFAAPETTSHFFLSFAPGEKTPDPGISTLFFGDTMFDRKVAKLIDQAGPEVVFANLRGTENRFFLGSHLNFLNLEGPITKLNPSQRKLVSFQQHHKTPEILQSAHFNLVSLANNHALDSGEAGLIQTIESLESKQIKSIGTEQKPCHTEQVKELKIAICAFDDTVSMLDPAEAAAVISAAKAEHQRVVASLHWGQEYQSEANYRQQKLAHKLIDSGADLIIGHHPHVIQPLEIYQGRPIIYSLGNFVFDQVKPQTQQGLAVGSYFTDDQLTLYFYPFELEQMQPRLLNYQESLDFYTEYLGKLEKYQNKDLAGKLEFEL